MDIAKWQSQPNLARALGSFLDSPAGKHFMALLRHEFRAKPLSTPVVAGVDYMQVHAFRNTAREACVEVFDFIEAAGVSAEKKPRLPDTGWATEPLRREPEKEERKTSPRKKKK